MFSTARARISELERIVAKLIGETAALEKLVHDLSGRVERGSTVALRADLDNLLGRVESISTSNRKEFGRLWALQRGEAKEGPAEASIPTDDEFSAQLALQRQYTQGH